MPRLTSRQRIATTFCAVELLGLAVLLQWTLPAVVAVPVFSVLVLGHLGAVLAFASVLGLLPAVSSAQTCAARNTSCKTKPCCQPPVVPVPLVCTAAFSCKEATGLTTTTVRTTTTLRSSTTLPTVTTTKPGATVTTTTRPSVTTTSSTRPPATTTTTLPRLTFTGVWGPYRPNNCDLSLAWTASLDSSIGNEDGFVWCDICGVVHTCSEYERDVKEWTQVRVTTDLDAAYADLCPAASKSAWGPSSFNAIFARLGEGYEGRALCTGSICDEPSPAKPSGGGLWFTKKSGHHYQIEEDVQGDYRDCLTRKENRAACMQRLATDAPTRVLLNLNTTCDGPHEVTQFVTHPKLLAKQGKLKYDSVRGESAAIDGRASVNARMKALSNRPADRAALALTERSHAHASGLPVDGDWVGTQIAHVQYEALCCEPGKPCDEQCLHFRAVKPFRGGCAPRWTATQCAQWMHLVHFPYHEKWGAEQLTGNWPKVRVLGDAPHANAHECLIGNNPKLEVIMPCDESPDHPENCEWGPERKRGKMTCQAYLPILVEKYLGGQP
jgi:hypothetical protein